MSDGPAFPRTVTEARRTLDELAPQLNPEMYRRHAAEVAEAETAATSKAETFVHDKFTEAQSLGVEIATEACAVRDDAAALLRELQAGTTTAREANAAINELRARHRRVASQAEAIATTAASVEAIEADPVGWSDSLLTRFPELPRPSFTF